MFKLGILNYYPFEFITLNTLDSFRTYIFECVCDQIDNNIVIIINDYT